MKERMDWADLIGRYYDQRGLKWPTTQQALLWAMSEVGEAANDLLQGTGGWVRNNPDTRSGEELLNDYATELGDAIMMLIVAGLVVNRNPLAYMHQKIARLAPGLITAEDL